MARKWWICQSLEQSDMKLKGSLNTFLQRKVQILYKYQGFKVTNVSFLRKISVKYLNAQWMYTAACFFGSSCRNWRAPTITQLRLFTCVLWKGLMSHKVYFALFMDQGSKCPGGKTACVVSAAVNWALRGTFSVQCMWIWLLESHWCWWDSCS